MPVSALARIVRERCAFATSEREFRSRLCERLALMSISRETHALAHSGAQRERAGVRAWRRSSGMDTRFAAHGAASPTVNPAPVSRPPAAYTALRASGPGVTREFAPTLRPRSRGTTAVAAAAFPAMTHRRAAKPASASSMPAAKIVALQRTAPLVWRQAASRGEETLRTPQGPVPALREAPAPRAALPVREGQPPRAPAASPPPPSSMPRLDAAFVDRLAEDVIRRVEKRARVERERRGL